MVDLFSGTLTDEFRNCLKDGVKERREIWEWWDEKGSEIS